jgi:hypothetical protein
MKMQTSPAAALLVAGILCPPRGKTTRDLSADAAAAAGEALAVLQGSALPSLPLPSLPLLGLPDGVEDGAGTSAVLPSESAHEALQRALSEHCARLRRAGGVQLALSLAAAASSLSPSAAVDAALALLLPHAPAQPRPEDVADEESFAPMLRSLLKAKDVADDGAFSSASASSSSAAAASFFARPRDGPLLPPSLADDPSPLSAVAASLFWRSDLDRTTDPQPAAATASARRRGELAGRVAGADDDDDDDGGHFAVADALFGGPAAEMLRRALDGSLVADDCEVVGPKDRGTASTDGEGSSHPSPVSVAAPLGPRLFRARKFATPVDRARSMHEDHAASAACLIQGLPDPSNTLASPFLVGPASSAPAARPSRPVPFPPSALPLATRARLRVEEDICRAMLLAAHGVTSELFVLDRGGARLELSGAALHSLVTSGGGEGDSVLGLTPVLLPSFDAACRAAADAGTLYLQIDRLAEALLSGDGAGVQAEVEAGAGREARISLRAVAAALLARIRDLDRAALDASSVDGGGARGVVASWSSWTVMRTLVTAVRPAVHLLRAVRDALLPLRAPPPAGGKDDGVETFSALIPARGAALVQRLYTAVSLQLAQPEVGSSPAAPVPGTLSPRPLPSTLAVLFALFDAALAPLLSALDRQVGRRAPVGEGAELDGLARATAAAAAAGRGAGGSTPSSLALDPRVLLDLLPPALAAAPLLPTDVAASRARGGEPARAALQRAADTFSLLRRHCPSLARALHGGAVDDGSDGAPRLSVPTDDLSVYNLSLLHDAHAASAEEAVRRWCEAAVAGLHNAASSAGAAPAGAAAPGVRLLPEHALAARAALGPFRRRTAAGARSWSPRFAAGAAAAAGPGPLRRASSSSSSLPSASGPTSVSAPASASDLFTHVYQGAAADRYESAASRRATAAADARGLRAAAERDAADRRATVEEAKRDEFARLTAQLDEAAERKRKAKEAQRAEGEREARALRVAEELGTSPLKGGAELRPLAVGSGDGAGAPQQQTLYEAARLVLLRDFGERIRGLREAEARRSARTAAAEGVEGGGADRAADDDAVPEDPVLLALEALASLGPSGAAQASALAQQLGLEPTPGDADGGGGVAGKEDEATLPVPRAEPALNLFAVLPELEGLLPPSIASRIRVTQPTGGFDSAGVLLAGDFLVDGPPPRRVGVVVSQPPGGTSTLELSDAVADGGTPTKSGVRVRQSPGGDAVAGLAVGTAATASASPSEAGGGGIRVTQPAGGHSVAHGLVYGDGEPLSALSPRAAASDAVGALLRRGPDGAPVEAAVDGTRQREPQPQTFRIGEDASAGPADPVQTGIRILQPGGAPSTVAGLLVRDGDGEGEGAGGPTPSPVSGPPATSVRITQPAGGVTVIGALLQQDDVGFRVDSAGVEGPRGRLRKAVSGAGAGGGGGASTVEGLLYGGGDGDGAAAADPERPEGKRAVPTAKGAKSTAQNFLYQGQAGNKGTGVAAEAAAAARTKAANEATAAAARVGAGSWATALASRARRTSFDPADFLAGFLPGLGGAFFGADDVPNRFVEEEEEGRPVGHDDANPASAYSNVRLTVPFSAAFAAGIVLPLAPHVSLVDTAGAALVLLHFDLPSHLAALRAWLLLSEGAASSSLLDHLCEARERVIVAEPRGSAPDEDAGAPRRRAARAAAHAATSAYSLALVETGVSREFEAFCDEARRRVRVGLHGTRGVLEGAVDRLGALAAPALAGPGAGEIGGDDGSTLPAAEQEEALLTILREARANARTSAAAAHSHRFRYLPTEGASGGGGDVVPLSWWSPRVLDALVRPTYDLRASPLDHAARERAAWLNRARGAGRDEDGDSIPTSSPSSSTSSQRWTPLELVLHPEALLRYSALHLFLLRLRRTQTELRTAWISIMAVRRRVTPKLRGWAATSAEEAAVASSPAAFAVLPLAVSLFRHEAAHFLSALDGYLTSAVLGAAYTQLLSDISPSTAADEEDEENMVEVGRHGAGGGGRGRYARSIDGLRAAHDQYLRTLLTRCLLPDPAAPPPSPAVAATSPVHLASRLLDGLLGHVLDFCALVDGRATAILHPERARSRRGGVGAGAEVGGGEEEEAGEEGVVFPRRCAERLGTLQDAFGRSARLLVAGLRAMSAQGAGFAHVDDLLVRLGPWGGFEGGTARG